MKVRKLQRIGDSVGVTLPKDELEEQLGAEPLDHLEEHDEYVFVDADGDGFNLSRLG